MNIRINAFFLFAMLIGCTTQDAVQPLEVHVNTTAVCFLTVSDGVYVLAKMKFTKVFSESVFYSDSGLYDISVDCEDGKHWESKTTNLENIKGIVYFN